VQQLLGDVADSTATTSLAKSAGKRVNDFMARLAEAQAEAFRKYWTETFGPQPRSLVDGLPGARRDRRRAVRARYWTDHVPMACQPVLLPPAVSLPATYKIRLPVNGDLKTMSRLRSCISHHRGRRQSAADRALAVLDGGPCVQRLSPRTGHPRPASFASMSVLVAEA
jgi:hypothetical protein